MKARLRTKTGCLTCRSRRVKCNEEHPCCSNCAHRGVDCLWPFALDLYDRRHRRQPRTGGKIDTLEMAIIKEYFLKPLQTNAKRAGLGASMPRSLTAGPIFHSDLEVTLFQHCCDEFLSSILLPGAHPGFYNGYLSYCMDLATNYDGVQCSMLACSAMHRYMLTNDPKFREFSLVYYSRAVKEVYRLINMGDWSQDKLGDPTITSIIWLYIHSLWGQDTTEDSHKHVRGAVRLLNLRYSQSQNPLSMAKPWDRVTTESVLYQTLVLSIRHPFKADFSVDLDFFFRSENMLESMTFVDVSPTANSPVLGLPIQLYRLVLSVTQFCSSLTDDTQEKGRQLKSEMARWEDAINHLQPAYDVDSVTQDDFHSITIVLYVLATSILLDLVLYAPAGEPTQPWSLPRSTSRWQLRRAMEILASSAVQEQWTSCFLGSWPLQIFGYAVESEQDIGLIRKIIKTMRERIGFGEIERIITELESLWKSGSRPSSSAESCIGQQNHAVSTASQGQGPERESELVRTTGESTGS